MSNPIEDERNIVAFDTSDVAEEDIDSRLVGKSWGSLFTEITRAAMQEGVSVLDLATRGEISPSMTDDEDDKKENEDKSVYHLGVVPIGISREGMLESIVLNLYCDGVHTKMIVGEAKWNLKNVPEIVGVVTIPIENMGVGLDLAEAGALGESIIRGRKTLGNQIFPTPESYTSKKH